MTMPLSDLSHAELAALHEEQDLGVQRVAGQGAEVGLDPRQAIG